MLMAVGDIHLGALANYIPTLWKKQIKNLQNIFDYAVDHDIEHVFLLGDIFDSPNPSDQLKIWLRKLLWAYRKTLTFHVVIGNHDWESNEKHALQILQDLGETGLFNFKVYTKPEVIKVDGISLFMCSHPHVLDVPSKNVDWCLGHFAWHGAKADNGFAVKSGKAPKGRWILGDFHTHQYGDRYVYCGTVSQVLWSEKLPKGVVLFDKDDWNFKPFKPTYTLGIVEVETENALRDLDTSTFWSMRTVNGFTLPPGFKQKAHNIVHLAPAKRRKDIRAAVLLAKEDSILRNPLHLLKDFLVKHKSDLKKSEIKYAIKAAKSIYSEVLR